VIYLIVYLVMIAVTARWLAPHLLDEVAGDKPDRADVLVSRAMALLIGLLWPVVLLGALVMWRTPKSRGQLRQDLAARDARIAELERENGIGDTRGPL
jgi:hypothetical protein